MQMNRTRYSRLDDLVAAEVRAEIARHARISVKGLAEQLGIRRATLIARLNGSVPFSPSLLAALAAELHTTASALIARAEAAAALVRTGEAA